MLKRLLSIVILLWLPFASAGASQQADGFNSGDVLPRQIIALYDAKVEGDPRYTLSHRFLEMPLNHLGYIVKYHDINESFPKIDESVRGVIAWFTSETQLDDPSALFEWLHKAIDKKKKLLVMGGLGVSEKFRAIDKNLQSLNRIMHRIGVHDRNNWVNILHNVEISSVTPDLTNFERNFKGEIKPYQATNKVGSNAKTHLRLKAPQYEAPYSDLIVTNENGGYVAHNYGVFQFYNGDGDLVLSQWFINPFIFLSEVFDDEYLPKPDTTTLFGRRIFYSHLDGDGWNNLTEVAKYRKKGVLSSDVLYEEVFKPYSDFGFTVGLIVSEIDPQCHGTPQSIPVAKKTLALHNVEPGSHTYSHPLHWEFFADGDASKEQKYKNNYKGKGGKRFFVSEWLMDEGESPIDVGGEGYKALSQPDKDIALRGIRDPNTNAEEVLQKYDTPRSYACEAFNLDKEVRGSIDYIEKLAGGKKVKLYQWSGNTTPFEAAIRYTREQGLFNINGGDSRFDSEYPSYATVSPLSAPIGEERQIYSSNSNENTYTNLWTDRFFGFKYLQTTVNNTESPIRVAPYNLYFHSYSGEKDAALTAVKENLEFARKQSLIPIYSSEYAAIATSYFSMDIKKLGHEHWKVMNRGNLQTIRIDKATLKSVDFERSKGVIGQNYYQGSLYIALDESNDAPVIKLKAVEKTGEYPKTTVPYIVESNWKIKSLQFSKNSLMFSAIGFGDSDILLQMPNSVEAKIQLYKGKDRYEERVIKTDVYNQLRLIIDDPKEPIGVSIQTGEE